MKYYHGRRAAQSGAVDVEEDGEVCLLRATADLDWGYSAGSGALPLALALATDVLGDGQRARQVAPRLARTLIDKLPDDGWVLSERQVRAAIEVLEQEPRRTR
ncbi:MAG TPA: DUF6166 domain-containing protein [Gemmataceae bacterium]|nr:DUF6166 domain-containing protein [Gemmataceae bacterium]